MQNTKDKEYTTWESLPDTLTAHQIAKFLGISRRRVYELLQLHEDRGGIPNFSIGASKRIEKSDLQQWVKNKKKAKVK